MKNEPDNSRLLLSERSQTTNPFYLQFGIVHSHQLWLEQTSQAKTESRLLVAKNCIYWISVVSIYLSNRLLDTTCVLLQDQKKPAHTLILFGDPLDVVENFKDIGSMSTVGTGAGQEDKSRAVSRTRFWEPVTLVVLTRYSTFTQRKDAQCCDCILLLNGCETCRTPRRRCFGMLCIRKLMPPKHCSSVLGTR